MSTEEWDLAGRIVGALLGLACLSLCLTIIARAQFASIGLRNLCRLCVAPIVTFVKRLWRLKSGSR
jgi:hypothetical protein